MKKIIFIFIIIILITSCSTTVKTTLPYQPVVEISLNDTLYMTLSPGEDNVWDWDDIDSISVRIILTEKDIDNAYLVSLNWLVENYEGQNRENNDYVLLEPIELKKGASDTIYIPLYLRGNDAQNLDENDGNEDSVAKGIVSFNATYYDNKGVVYTTIRYYAYIKITK